MILVREGRTDDLLVVDEKQTECCIEITEGCLLIKAKPDLFEYFLDNVHDEESCDNRGKQFEDYLILKKIPYIYLSAQYMPIEKIREFSRNYNYLYNSYTEMCMDSGITRNFITSKCIKNPITNKRSTVYTITELREVETCFVVDIENKQVADLYYSDECNEYVLHYKTIGSNSLGEAIALSNDQFSKRYGHLL